MKSIFIIACLFIFQCSIVKGENSLKNFSKFCDCCSSIDILARNFTSQSQKDTLSRVNNIVAICTKINARRKVLDYLSKGKIPNDRLKNFIVIEWCADILPYRALYCGEKIYFVKIDYSGIMKVLQFDDKNLQNNIKKIKTTIADYREWGNLSLSGRGSVFWFITDVQTNKSIVIHDLAMEVSRHSKLNDEDMKLLKIYNECLNLIDDIGIKRWE
ncbi:MAG: hypothetical protein IKD23_08915 [Lentisphaeria bacterium]|nr:hypothetical protein [Lentisphaeria bacterium]